MNISTKKTFSYPITVEFEDVDAYRIVHHVAQVTYLERARIHFLRFLDLPVFPDGLDIVVYNLEMRFRKPALFSEQLTVDVFIESMDEYLLRLGYRITRLNDLVARATTGLAFSDTTTRQIVPIPQNFQAAFAPYVVSPPVPIIV